LDETALKTRFASVSQGADLTLVEGVMGLFDGKDALGKVASSAHLAKLLGCPVILAIDASAMAGSIAALAQGFRRFDREVRVAGVIANRVGSERHADILRTALQEVDIPLLGFVKRDAGLELPSRHLGLQLTLGFRPSLRGPDLSRGTFLVLAWQNQVD
jgi:cobyrinic acid a,c-diamide synthase